MHRKHVVPGHEVVAEVIGGDLGSHSLGDRVGIPWLRSTCGQCRYCLRGDENLCPASTYTGWDATAGTPNSRPFRQLSRYPLPSGYDPVTLAPLLCAGIIGYRACCARSFHPAACSDSTASAAART